LVRLVKLESSIQVTSWPRDLGIRARLKPPRHPHRTTTPRSSSPTPTSRRALNNAPSSAHSTMEDPGPLSHHCPSTASAHLVANQTNSQRNTRDNPPPHTIPTLAATRHDRKILYTRRRIFAPLLPYMEPTKFSVVGRADVSVVQDYESSDRLYGAKCWYVQSLHKTIHCVCIGS
jgi:hypothetical protein